MRWHSARSRCRSPDPSYPSGVKSAYRVLNYLLSLEVLIQAAVIAWYAFGIYKYADDNGSISHHQLEDGGFNGHAGAVIHAVNGFMIIPFIALVLLVVSFFAKIPGGVRLAVITFALVVVQAFVLPALSAKAPAVGMLHGAVALAILGISIAGARLARDATAPSTAGSATGSTAGPSTGSTVA
jgi:hypothetical protein